MSLQFTTRHGGIPENRHVGLPCDHDISFELISIVFAARSMCISTDIFRLTNYLEYLLDELIAAMMKYESINIIARIMLYYYF